MVLVSATTACSRFGGAIALQAQARQKAKEAETEGPASALAGDFGLSILSGNSKEAHHANLISVEDNRRM